MIKKLVSSLFGKRSSVPSGTAMGLRSENVARQFPTTLPVDHGVIAEEDFNPCPACGGSRTPVVITTGGTFGSLELWRAHPVSIKGLQCGACQKISFPAQLSADEVGALWQRAAESLRRKHFDDAEFCFMQLVNSAPSAHLFRANLGSVYQDKRTEAEIQGSSPEIIDMYRQRARAQWLEALECPDGPPPILHFWLAKNFSASGESESAVHHIERFLENPAGAALADVDTARRLLEMNRPR